MGVTSDTEASMSSLTDVGGDDGPPLKNNSASSLATEGSVFKKKSLSQSFNCPHCNYRAKQYMNLHRHLLLHQIKSNYSCPLCSYSALRVGGITRHLNRHHPENDDTENETALPKSTIQAESSSTLKAKQSPTSALCEAEKWYYDRNGRRFRYLLCDACPYKTKIRSCLEDHIKTTHPSTAAPATPPVKRQITLYCDICEFMTRDKVAFQVHGMRHQEKSVYKCKKCSFSVPHPNVLENHMKHHHSKRKRVVNQTQKNAAVSDTEKEEWYYAPGGGRMRYKFCQHCPYKSPVRFAFQQHMKKQHPFSELELPAAQSRKNKARLRRCTDCPFGTWIKGQFEKHMTYHENKSAHLCHVCGVLLGNRSQLSLHLKRNHQTPQPNQAGADQEGHHNQYAEVEENESNIDMAEPTPYPAPKQKKSRIRVPLKTRHSLFGRKRATSTSLLRHPPKTRRKLILLRCSHCPFTAYSMRDLRYHEALHQKKSAHECHACSYSVNKLSHLHHHLRLHHSESEKFEAKLTVNQEQASRKRAGLECLEDSNAERKERSIKAQLALRECRVVLVNMFSNCCFDAEFIEAMKPSTENRVKKEEEKLQEVRMQVEVLTKTAWNADEEVKEIVSNKTDLKRRITKIEGRKAKLEETIRILQVQVNESENELVALRELDESFSQDLENANKVAVEASEALCALRLEAEGLESANSL